MDSAYTTVVDKNNVKWIGTLEGLCRFDGENWVLYNTDNCPIPGNQINDLAFDREGHLWMATEGGVAVFDCNDQWDTFRAGDKLPRCMYQNVTIDRNGNIWFGTDDKGLWCLSGYQMKKPEVAQASDNPDSSEPSDDTKSPNISGSPSKADGNKGNATQPETEDRIKLIPNLEEGYLTILMNSPQAEVTFINSKGEKVRTVPKYQTGSHINISKMKKGAYTVRVKTSSGTRSVKFTLK